MSQCDISKSQKFTVTIRHFPVTEIKLVRGNFGLEEAFFLGVQEDSKGKKLRILPFYDTRRTVTRDLNSRVHKYSLIREDTITKVRYSIFTK